MKKQIIYSIIIFVALLCSSAISYSQIDFEKCCGNPSNPLPCNATILQNDQRVYFSGMDEPKTPLGDLQNAVGIGYNCGNPLIGKLSVNQTYPGTEINFPSVAGHFTNGDISWNVSNFFEKKGIYASCTGRYYTSDQHYPWTYANVGGDFEAYHSSGKNIAVRGRVGLQDHIYPGYIGYGGQFSSHNCNGFNYGVWAMADGNSISNIGVYGEAPVGVCQDFPGVCTDAAGYFNGDLFYEAGIFHGSDARLKDNIKPLINSMDIIKSLSPKLYTFRREEFKTLHLASGIEGGLIAQDVQKVLPQLVGGFKLPHSMNGKGEDIAPENSETYLSVNYVGLIPYLISAIKEQQENIESLQSQLDETKSQIANCCDAGRLKTGMNKDDENNQRSTIDVQISNANTIILNQNSPNPFSEETFITYTIPEIVSKASIVIYNNSGEVLKTVTINERGEGTLHIYAEKLSTGIYSYSLIADGKTIDTKKMSCQK